MHIDGLLVLGSAVVGLLVGLTGAGGGALMTPMLIFVFGVAPTAAISSDVVAAVLMRPVGAAVHLRRGTVHRKMVAWLSAGSVPGALLGAFLLHVLGSGRPERSVVEAVLGAALLLGAAAMVVRAALRRRTGEPVALDPPVRPLPTAVIGALGGVMVGMTSVGAGSLMMVLLLFAYPTLASSALVGTDLAQAVPLTAAAALGQLLFGHVQVGLTLSVVLGSVPAVYLGSRLSARAPDRWVRPLITAAIVLSGLKYVGVGDAGLGVAVVVGLAGGVVWAGREWRRRAQPGVAPAWVPGPGSGPRSVPSDRMTMPVRGLGTK
ncbi:MAG: sulfite exporter TauE/SafE family protein [Acidimicrobiales bacterium]